MANNNLSFGVLVQQEKLTEKEVVLVARDLAKGKQIGRIHLKFCDSPSRYAEIVELITNEGRLQSKAIACLLKSAIQETKNGHAHQLYCLIPTNKPVLEALKNCGFKKCPSTVVKNGEIVSIYYKNPDKDAELIHQYLWHPTDCV